MDTRQLADLLDASLRLWSVSGRAMVDDRHHVRIRLTSGAEIRIESRGALDRRSAWRALPSADDGPDMPFTPIECSSLGALLKRLRMALDPDFVPARAIVGHSPRVQRESRQ